jgi:amidase
VSAVDPVGAFVPHGHFRIDGRSGGPLSGLTFLAKDLYDVAGHPTGAGNPDWLKTHPVPGRHSPLVLRLLDAGADLVGKVITDELAYSINGDNVHYGTPVNVNAPGRVPGGSSSGSAAAVAASLADFALGTDTGGSIRIPASYCGVWGLRTTHGSQSGEGVVALARSYDTFGWLARDSGTFARVGEVLLAKSAVEWKNALIVEDAWSEADPEVQPLLEALARTIANLVAAPRRISIGQPDLDTWRKTYITVSAHEAWREHGAWVESAHPVFGPAVTQRFEYAKAVSAEEAAKAGEARSRHARRVLDALGTDTVAIVPSAAGPAPRLEAHPAEIDAWRMRSMRITSIAGHAGVPQVSLPLRGASGLPIGVSLIGPRGSDAALLALARRAWLFR